MAPACPALTHATAHAASKQRRRQLIGGANRVEQLANAFAAALLMPRRVVEPAADWRSLSGKALTTARAMISTKHPE
jgi:Zn-dependent peptidase ImmA (M78 family)